MKTRGTLRVPGPDGWALLVPMAGTMTPSRAAARTRLSALDTTVPTRRVLHSGNEWGGRRCAMPRGPHSVRQLVPVDAARPRRAIRSGWADPPTSTSIRPAHPTALRRPTTLTPLPFRGGVSVPVGHPVPHDPTETVPAVAQPAQAGHDPAVPVARSARGTDVTGVRTAWPSGTSTASSSTWMVPWSTRSTWYPAPTPSSSACGSAAGDSLC